MPAAEMAKATEMAPNDGADNATPITGLVTVEGVIWRP